MKFYAIASFLLLVFLTSFSQTEKGRYSLGTGVFFGSYSKGKSHTAYSLPNSLPFSYETSDIYLSITPNAGKFLADNFLVGINTQVLFFNTNLKYDDDSYEFNSNRNTYSIGPFMQYFFGDNVKAKPFVSGSVRFGYGPYKTESTNTNNNKTNTEGKETNINGVVNLGYAIFLNDSFFLTAYLGYSYDRFKSDVDIDTMGSASYSSTDKDTYNRISIGVTINTTFKKRDQ